MKQYWVSMIIQNEHDKRAWLCPMMESVCVMDEAKDLILKARKQFTVLSAWIDMFDEDGIKETVYHECYINPLGMVIGIR